MFLLIHEIFDSFNTPPKINGSDSCQIQNEKSSSGNRKEVESFVYTVLALAQVQHIWHTINSLNHMGAYWFRRGCWDWESG